MGHLDYLIPLTPPPPPERPLVACIAAEPRDVQEACLQLTRSAARAIERRQQVALGQLVGVSSERFQALGIDHMPLYRALCEWAREFHAVGSALVAVHASQLDGSPDVYVTLRIDRWTEKTHAWCARFRDGRKVGDWQDTTCYPEMLAQPLATEALQ